MRCKLIYKDLEAFLFQKGVWNKNLVKAFPRNLF